MRCFFLRNGHIAAVEMLPGLSDQDAIAKAQNLFFLDRQGQFEGFEIWERTRSVFRHPNRDAAKPAVNQSPRARLADDIPERIRSAPWMIRRHWKAKRPIPLKAQSRARNGKNAGGSHFSAYSCLWP